eukprot:Nk52_evm23s292 gene=Nk52_evmTU23s292
MLEERILCRVVLGLLLVCLCASSGARGATVEEYLQRGKLSLAKGDFNDALMAYDEAIKLNPSNYMTYYRRGTTYLASGKTKNAMGDFNKVIDLQPDFLAAYSQRALHYLKSGKIPDAEENFKEILKREPSHQEATKGLEDCSRLDTLLKATEDAQYHNQFREAMHSLTAAVEISPFSEAFRMKRAGIFMKMGDLHGAVGDVTRATKLKNDHTEAYLLLSSLYYKLGESEQSLQVIRECLKLDQDHKECKKIYLKVKKLDKQLRELKNFVNDEKWTECLQKVTAAMKTEKQEAAFVNLINAQKCHCEQRKGDDSKAIKTCGDVIEATTDSSQKVNALCDRAEAYLNMDNFDKAIGDFQSALEIDKHSTRASSGIEKAQQLKKQAGKRNYYKILGVQKNASKKEILKAYKKLAMVWHPDKYQGDDKEMAENKFVDISAAKEVLTDPEKRKQFDMGIDPLDPEQKQQQGNPFQGGFNPFGSGGFGGFPGGGGGGQKFTFHFG